MRLHFPIATALRSTLKGYGAAQLRQDLVAGLIVSLLALPLSMALSIAVGLPPQHGIYTAIVAGTAAAILGGSVTQVSGPTAAFVVIVAPIVTQYGLHGIVWCSMMAGVLLMVMGTAGFGRYINFVPYPVTTGFTAGIAVVIGTLALNDFFGLNLPALNGSYFDKASTIVTHLPSLNPYELGIGLATLLLILHFGKITRAIPGTIVGIAAGALIGFLLQHQGIEIATIGSRFSYLTPEGLLQHGIPPYPPQFHLPGGSDPLYRIPDYAEFKILIVPAMVIAALGALESLLSASVSDSMAGTRHNPNAELNGIGIANILSGLVTGIPATGAIARTAANVHAGAKSPIASVVHALMILLYVLLLAPWLSYIPMASLAALLLVTAWRMSHVKQFIRTVKIAPASDTLVLVACFSLTVFVDMVAGVSVGIVLASLLFMKRISELTEFNLTPLPGDFADRSTLALPDHVMIYRIDGPLFFGTVEKAFDRYRFVHDHIDTLIIDMEHVPLIDMTGLVAMKTMLTGIAREHRKVILCGKKEITDRILHKIEGHEARDHVTVVPTLAEAAQLVAAATA
jgi:SulP family sulfate permease